MDMPEFLEKLKTSKHKTRWYLSNEGKIRSEFGWCPMHFVSFLSEKPQPPDLCFRANIGLKKDDISKIISAADNWSDCDKKLRENMLNILGLVDNG
jgi:hypothetical protein